MKILSDGSSEILIDGAWKDVADGASIGVVAASTAAVGGLLFCHGRAGV